MGKRPPKRKSSSRKKLPRASPARQFAGMEMVHVGSLPKGHPFWFSEGLDYLSGVVSYQTICATSVRILCKPKEGSKNERLMDIEISRSTEVLVKGGNNGKTSL